MEKNRPLGTSMTNLILFLLGLTLLLFPFIFTPLTTDVFTLPKQTLLGIASIFGLVLFGANMLALRKVVLRKTPIDAGFFLFGLAVFLSALFSVNRADSLIAFVPLLFAMIVSQLLVHTAKHQSSFLFLLTMFLLGACTTAIISVLTVFRIYIFPFTAGASPLFAPMGSLLDQLIFLVVSLLIALSLLHPLLKPRLSGIQKKTVFSFLACIILIAGVAASSYQLFFLNQALPVTGGRIMLLPFATGFQTAFATISQDATRPIQGFLFGSGFGTYSSDFTRFKHPIFNLNPDIWQLTFFRSSSFLLELLATTGVLGTLTFLLLLFQSVRKSQVVKTPLQVVKENPVTLAIIAAMCTSFFLPFSPILQATFFIVLGLFIAGQALIDTHRFYDVELSLFASRDQTPNTQHQAAPVIHFGFGTMPAKTEQTSSHQNTATKFLPVSVFLLCLAFAGVLGFYSTFYLLSDLTFQRALTAYNARNSLQTYNQQLSAITMFPYRDGYYRVYSQLNLELANSLLSSLQKEKNPDQKVQATIYDLIQQSLNTARSATTLSPLTASNWQNLAAIYRSLIGFGKQAENFAIASSQQAVGLDPNNPQSYINLGGIYYQLGRWDDAQRQFQIAINLKPDFANAHYNLGHALEQKGELEQALKAYETVKSLTKNDTQALQKIEDEIATLKERIGSAKRTQADVPGEAGSRSAGQEQPPLKISSPSAQLPAQNPPVDIPPPSVATQSGQ